MAVQYDMLQKDLPLFGGFSTNFNTIAGSIGDVFSYLWLLGIVICLLAGALVIGVGGVRLTAADSGTKARDIKTDIMRAVYGVLGVLALWLILYQVNPDLLRGEISFAPIEFTGTSISTPTSGTPGTGGTPTPVITTPLPPGACTRKSNPPCQAGHLTAILADEDATRTKLNNEVNAGKCTSVGQSGCTNVGLLSSEVVSMVISLKAACNCKVVVSGGTEWWSHSTHGPEVPVVDFKSNDATLNAFIRKQPTSPKSSGCIGGVVYNWNGWKFCDEGSGTYTQTTGRHWHVNR